MIPWPGDDWDVGGRTLRVAGRLQSAREPGTESAITDTAPEKLAHEEEQGSRTVTPRKCGGEVLKHFFF